MKLGKDSRSDHKVRAHTGKKGVQENTDAVKHSPEQAPEAGKVSINLRLERLARKALWFIGLGVVTLFSFGGISQLLIIANGKKVLSHNDTIALLVLTTIVLCSILLIASRLLRKKPQTLIRWSRRSVFILCPLMIVAVAVGIYLSNTNQMATVSSSNQTNQTGLIGISGNKRYIDGLTFKNDSLLKATNDARAANGLAPLSSSADLDKSALSKCNDMVARNYWSHDNPDGKEPWKFIDETGYSYNTAGENLAYGFNSESSVVSGWMNSPGHRANILNKAFKEVGFGVCKGENYMAQGPQLVVVQHFADPYVAPVVVQPKAYVAPVCTKTMLPYNTNYQDVNYLYVGQTSSYGGYEGFVQTCTADSTGYKPQDFRIEPIDKTVLVGTKPVVVPDTTPVP